MALKVPTGSLACASVSMEGVACAARGAAAITTACVPKNVKTSEKKRTGPTMP
jgi:hypothetical protein